ncbi:hypothetical protein RJ639_012361 [Escallonia herrerae]|uniref:Zinc finger CCCH domain-containing protein 18-like n=1 Tax=Escallonia herrerae TaxID=1293975 RepID=A0AA88VM02_9ASTE|nr:hypothetical protein RJ639_012361 [Escallonia herrerae]
MWFFRLLLGTERLVLTRCQMDSFEATKVVYSRILKLEPEFITKKIIGYIYLQDHADGEMIRLAFGPDQLIHNLIQKAKIELGLSSKPAFSPPMSPSMQPVPISDLPLQFAPFSPRPLPSPPKFRLPMHYWDPQFVEEQPMHHLDFMPFTYSDSIPEDYGYQNRTQLVGFEDHLEPSMLGGDYCFGEAALGKLSTRGSRQSLNVPEFPVKVCHYFNKGFCKHGSNCRYYHGEAVPESYPLVFSPNSNDIANEDHLFSPRSLEKLEMDFTEILMSRRGSPVSIASLPMIYYEKYGKTLQAEGYLTESQRHGKAGYSLTKLLARLNNIRLIDRPHGQHSVILAEDAPKYMQYRSERNDPGPIVSGSRQIYLTFPAESTFTEEDVSNYFNTFGPVQDVRIPCQQKRMFGFVTFVSADTVKMILSKGNPHYVCGARVLVKPYREKSKLVDRKYPEKLESSMYYHSQHADMDSELHARLESRLLRKQLMEEQEEALELERRRLSELKLARKSPTNQMYLECSMADQLKLSGNIDHADNSKFPTAERFNYLLDVLNNDSPSDDNPKNTSTNHPDQENSQGLNLPDSPFASPLASGISTVT